MRESFQLHCYSVVHPHYKLIYPLFNMCCKPQNHQLHVLPNLGTVELRGDDPILQGSEKSEIDYIKGQYKVLHSSKIIIIKASIL